METKQTSFQLGTVPRGLGLQPVIHGPRQETRHPLSQPGTYSGLQAGARQSPEAPEKKILQILPELHLLQLLAVDRTEEQRNKVSGTLGFRSQLPMLRAGLGQQGIPRSPASCFPVAVPGKTPPWTQYPLASTISHALNAFHLHLLCVSGLFPSPVLLSHWHRPWMLSPLACLQPVHSAKGMVSNTHPASVNRK